MRMSAEHCRAQQALQLAKAAEDPLVSRRTIALTAAKAWGAEAALADKREAQMTPLDALDMAITREFAREDAIAAHESDGHQSPWSPPRFPKSGKSSGAVAERAPRPVMAGKAHGG